MAWDDAYDRETWKPVWETLKSTKRALELGGFDSST